MIARPSSTQPQGPRKATQKPGGLSPPPRVAILISGGGSNMIRLVQTMRAHNYATPVLVVSNLPEAGGIAKAQALGIATQVIDHRTFGNDRTAFERVLVRALCDVDADIICLAGFMRILTPEAITPFSGRMMNIHPSLLPKYPGLHTHARAIAAGDTVAGCSVHLVTAELDAGPLLGQARVPILPDDDAESLAARVLVAEHRLYPQVLERFCADKKDPAFFELS